MALFPLASAMSPYITLLEHWMLHRRNNTAMLRSCLWRYT